MSSVHPTTVGLAAFNHLHNPENQGYGAIERLVIYRIIQLLHRHDDLDIVEDFDSNLSSSSADGADGASNQGNQNTSPQASSSPLSYEEKVERLVDAIMDGRRLRFSPSAGNTGYTVYAMSSPRSQQPGSEQETAEVDETEPEDGLEQQISAHPQNFGHVLCELGRTVTPYPTVSAIQWSSPDENVAPDPTGSAPGSAHPQNSGRVGANNRRPRTPFPAGSAIRGGSPDENVDSDSTGSASATAHPQNSGRVGANNRRPRAPFPAGSAIRGGSPDENVDSDSTGSASATAHPQNSGRVGANTRRRQTPFPTGSAIRGSSPDEIVPHQQEGYESYGSSPDEKTQGIQEWSAAVQEAASAISRVDGRTLTIMGQAGVEHHTISPIPFDLRRKVRITPGTPVVSSHGSILDCSSPSFVKTCKGIIKQSYLDIAPSLVPATTAPRSSHEGKGHRGARSLLDIGSDPGNPENLDVWVDVESSDINKENDQRVVANANALRDTTNLRRPGYLRYNSFYQDAKAKTENATTVDTAGPSSTTRQELPRITPPDSNASLVESFFTTNSNPEHDSAIAAAHAALEGVVISDSPDSQAPLSLVPRPLDLSRNLHIEQTLATLEGRAGPAAQSPSPIQRLVRPKGLYNNHVLLENLGPRLRHPKPSRHINARMMLAEMEAKLISEIKNRVGSPKGRSSERPSNPTPLRARHNPNQGTMTRGVFPGGRLIRRPASPTPLRVRYLKGEVSSD